MIIRADLYAFVQMWTSYQWSTIWRKQDYRDTTYYTSYIYVQFLLESYMWLNTGKAFLPSYCTYLIAVRVCSQGNINWDCNQKYTLVTWHREMEMDNGKTSAFIPIANQQQ